MSIALRKVRFRVGVGVRVSVSVRLMTYEIPQ